MHNLPGSGGSAVMFIFINRTLRVMGGLNAITRSPG
jgi:hypothetical protein